MTRVGVVADLFQRGRAVTELERWPIESPAEVFIATATVKPEEPEQLAADLARALDPRGSSHSACSR